MLICLWDSRRYFLSIRMGNRKENSSIRLRGVRQNNLKGFDLDIPLNRFVVITGPSGSGKSSLAFETLYAEGQRRYIETFSPYARQFFDRMDKPRVDLIESIPPAIAIEQKNAVKTVRSTVGTMTEICDYMKIVMPAISSLYCKNCGRIIKRESPQDIWESLLKRFSENVKNDQTELLITFNLALSEKLSLKETFNLILRQGYQRILVDGGVLNLEEAIKSFPPANLKQITVVQDRLTFYESSRSRFIDSCEQAYHFGKGRLAIFIKDKTASDDGWDEPQLNYSNHLHCADCNIFYNEPTPSLFSYNHPVGACPTCHGFGRVIGINYKQVIPNPYLSLAEGAIRPWQSGFSQECQDDLINFCKKRGVPVDVPFKDLSPADQKWVIEGDPDYGIDEAHKWPRCWYGVKGYFDWMESRAYKMHIRVLLSRYRSYTTCPDCKGGRFQPETLLYKIEIDSELAENLKKQGKCSGSLITLADIYLMPITDALTVVKSLSGRIKDKTPVKLALDEVISRMEYLVQIGLGYLTLNRPSRTLSGGETERVNLTACLGSRLVNTLYILDEPSVGLHPRDTERLIRILKNLRDIGNTVVVVEHEASVIRSADSIIDLGPGSGESGGNVIFQGSPEELLSHQYSLTGAYLSGRKKIEIPEKKKVCENDNGKLRWLSPYLTLYNARRHNLKNLTVKIPLRRFVCITGVSGSGKSTLIKECLLPALEQTIQQRKLSELNNDGEVIFKSENDEDLDERDSPDINTYVEGAELIDSVVLVDQSPPGKTPRSNPSLYIGAFDFIREFFASSNNVIDKAEAKSLFSFNSRAGGCDRCNGSGYEKIEMQFLSDIYIKCPECDGTRYKKFVLDIKIQPEIQETISCKTKCGNISKNIVDVLNGTVDEIVEWLGLFSGSKPALKARRMLEILQKVGLGYLRLGQPITTLSGGECQRLKLARSLAETIDFSEKKEVDDSRRQRSILFMFDEPTTGLHFDDIRNLLKVFYELVNNGHTVVVIEHNLDVIKCADWIIDLGPEAGDDGGKIVVCGTVDDVIACPQSHTGAALKTVIK